MLLYNQKKAGCEVGFCVFMNPNRASYLHPYFVLL